MDSGDQWKGPGTEGEGKQKDRKVNKGRGANGIMYESWAGPIIAGIYGPGQAHVQVITMGMAGDPPRPAFVDLPYKAVFDDSRKAKAD